jgi:site-specific DNA-adenine methylase
MSIQNAINFISEVDMDAEIRKSYYVCQSQTELFAKLAEDKKSFTEDDFENAVNMLLFKCQTYEQAGRVKEVKAWFKLFKRT